MKVHNMILSTVFALLLLGPAVLLTSQEVFGAELPIWLSSEEASYLTGDFTEGNSEDAVLEAATLRGFKNKEFQNALEEELNDHIPLKASALIGDATLQRAVIEASNALFGWKCYPALFGADYVIWPEGGSILSVSHTVSEANTQATEKLVESINAAAAQHPEVRFVFQEIVDTYASDMNPSHELVTDAYDMEWIRENVEERLSSDVLFILDEIASEDELRSQWFSTEHHWTFERALESYNSLAESLGLKLAHESADVEVFPEWSGANARGGLFFDYHDSLMDSGRAFDNLATVQHGQTISRGVKELDPSEYGLHETSFKYNAYHTYYGGLIDEVVYQNAGENNGKTCLFIEQSYGVPIERYIADNYACTIVTDPLNCNTTKTIDDYIQEFGVDEVIVQLGPAFIWRMADNSPALLGMD